MAISGSLREKSLNKAALNYAGTVMPEGKMSLIMANYSDLPIYNGDIED